VQVQGRGRLNRRWETGLLAAVQHAEGGDISNADATDSGW
jgi:preprotein translocase subunit SecA